MNKVKHVRILGWLFIANAALAFLAATGLLIGLTLGGIFSGEFQGMLTGPIAGVLVFVFMVVFALPGFLAGKGLLEGRGWARVLAMIIGALNFFSIPLGTALCIYTFWTLWGADADRHFEPGYASRYE